MEELRIEPCVNAGAADTDRKVTLEDHATRVGILAYLRELKVKVILNEAPEVDLCLVLLAECCNLLLVIFCISFPLREVRSAVKVTEDAECSVWEKPVSIVLDKCLISFCCRELLECLVECLVQELELGVVHALVVDLLKSVELGLESLVCLILLHSHCRKVQELRVEREGRVRVIRI